MPAPTAVAPAPPPVPESAPTLPPAAQEEAASAAAEAGSDRPEVIVGGAFAAGFAIALILKRLGN
jgi:NADPH-dependent 2,4-dienoyl-CoA reductase/sulfur reductase-like enzyme